MTLLQTSLLLVIAGILGLIGVIIFSFILASDAVKNGITKTVDRVLTIIEIVVLGVAVVTLLINIPRIISCSLH